MRQDWSCEALLLFIILFVIRITCIPTDKLPTILFYTQISSKTRDTFLQCLANLQARPFKSDFFFALSEFSLIKLCAELFKKIAIKTCKIRKNLVKLCQTYEKVPVLQVQRLKVKILRIL